MNINECVESLLKIVENLEFIEKTTSNTEIKDTTNKSIIRLKVIKEKLIKFSE